MTDTIKHMKVQCNHDINFTLMAASSLPAPGRLSGTHGNDMGKTSIRAGATVRAASPIRAGGTETAEAADAALHRSKSRLSREAFLTLGIAVARPHSDHPDCVLWLCDSLVSNSCSTPWASTMRLCRNSPFCLGSPSHYRPLMLA